MHIQTELLTFKACALHPWVHELDLLPIPQKLYKRVLLLCLIYWVYGPSHMSFMNGPLIIF
jgi:hypothetical protein